MKLLFSTLIIPIFFIFALTTLAPAQNSGDIQLPNPDQSGGKPLLQCLKDRHSSREFLKDELSLQELSNLLWAANGINRPESGKLTAPTAMNKQNMEVYVVLPSAIYFYEAKTYQLKLIASGNFMKLTGKQGFVDNAALNVVIVSDLEKLGNSDSEEKTLYSGIHAGAIVQNIYLFCASTELNTVTRRWFEADELKKAMNLPDTKTIILCQTVGKMKPE